MSWKYVANIVNKVSLYTNKIEKKELKKNPFWKTYKTY